MNYTNNIDDRAQLSMEGWKLINWNFDSSKSLIAFYGCQTAGFAERILDLLPEITHSAGQGAKVGPSYSTNKFKAVSILYSILETNKSVYYGSSENVFFEGVTLFDRK